MAMRPAPVLEYQGRRFGGFGRDYEDLAARYGNVVLGGAFTVAFIARWDGLQRWSRIIDFGNGPESGNIFVGNRGYNGSLAFHIWVGSAEFRVHVEGAIKLGTTHRYLCSVTAAGHMRVFIDGRLVGENPQGAAPPIGVRKHLYVGKSHWDRDALFQGEITDLLVWNAALDWQGADLGHLPQAAWAVPQLGGVASMPPPGPAVAAPPTAAAFSAGAGGGPPVVLAYEGREFTGTQFDFDNLAPQYGHLAFGGAFSIAFTARFDALNRWSHIIDFGNGPGDSNIFIGNRGKSGSLVFHVWVAGSEMKVEAPDLIIPGETRRYLCSVTAGGRMRMYRDGVLVGENRKGAAPAPGPRRNLYVGKSNWDWDQPFQGLIADLRVWSAAVGWDGQLAQEDTLDAFRGKVFVVDLSTVGRETEEFPGSDWLERRMRDGVPISWSLQWQPTTSEDLDSRPALLVLAAEDTVLMLRVHKTKEYLPHSVAKVLQCADLTKVIFDSAGLAVPAMLGAFGFEPAGTVNVAELASKTGHEARSLEALLNSFGYRVLQDHDSVSADWTKPELSQEQVRYAADLAHFTYVAWDLLNGPPPRPSPPPMMPPRAETPPPQPRLQTPGPSPHRAASVPPASALVEGGWGNPAGMVGAPGSDDVAHAPAVLDKEWQANCIERRGMAMWCAACDKGPMTASSVVDAHIASAAHLKKLEQRCSQLMSGDGGGDIILRLGRPVVMPAEYSKLHGIVTTKSPPGFAGNFYRCSICNAGPFNAMEVIDQHLQSKRHQKGASSRTAASNATPQQAADPYAHCRWNLPDYVREDSSGQLLCTLCDARAVALLPMCMHLGGGPHAKKCRGANLPEVIYSRERGRLEQKSSGEPVLRSGFEAPPLRKDDGDSDDEDASEGVAEPEPLLASEEREEQEEEEAEEEEDRPASLAEEAAECELAAQPDPPPPQPVEVPREAAAPPTFKAPPPLPRAPPLAEEPTRRSAGAADGQAAAAAACAGPRPGPAAPACGGPGAAASGGRWLSPEPNGDTGSGPAAAASSNGSAVASAPARERAALPQQLWAPGGLAAQAVPPFPALVPTAAVGGGGAPAAAPATLPARPEVAASAASASNAAQGGRPSIAREDPAPAPAPALAPGWCRVAHAPSGRFYYVDLETRRTQWEPPAVCAPGDWVRRGDASGRGRWESGSLGLSFGEWDASSGWRRYRDEAGRAYWSSAALQVRFWEDR